MLRRPSRHRLKGAFAEIALAFSDGYRMLNNRIGIFMNLPMASLDRLMLQKRLDAIGKPAQQPA
jgi:arsenate reductase